MKLKNRRIQVVDHLTFLCPRCSRKIPISFDLTNSLKRYKQQNNFKLLMNTEEKVVRAHYRHEHTKYEQNLNNNDYRRTLGVAAGDYADPVLESYNMLKTDENAIAKEFMEKDGFYIGSQFQGIFLTCYSCGRHIDASYKHCSKCKKYFCFECYTKLFSSVSDPKCPTCKIKLTKIGRVLF